MKNLNFHQLVNMIKVLITFAYIYKKHALNIYADLSRCQRVGVGGRWRSMSLHLLLYFVYMQMCAGWSQSLMDDYVVLTKISCATHFINLFIWYGSLIMFIIKTPFNTFSRVDPDQAALVRASGSGTSNSVCFWKYD